MQIAPEVGFELMKLLLQQAWADGKIAPAEAQLFRTFYVALGLDDAQQHAVEAWLAGTAKLEPPDLGALKKEREGVIQALALLSLSDDEVHPEEEELIAQIGALLK